MDFHESHPRNELIAKVFYMAGFIESWGRGYEKIKNAFIKEQLQIPTFEQVRGGILASIPRERFTALNKQNIDTNADIQLSERQRKIYLMVQNWSISEPLDEPLNTTNISKLTGISLSTVKRELTILQQKKLIIHVGGRKEGHWEIIK